MPHLGPTQDSIAVDVKPAGGRGMSWWSLFAPAQPPLKNHHPFNMANFLSFIIDDYR